MTVDATTAMPDLAAGQHVDVLGSSDSESVGLEGEEVSPVTQVATDAIVLRVVGDTDDGTAAGTTATLSVRSTDVLELGKATMSGPVVLVVRSG